MFTAKRGAIRDLAIVAAVVLGGAGARAGEFHGGGHGHHGGGHHGGSHHGGSHHGGGFNHHGGGFNHHGGGFGYVRPWNYGGGFGGYGYGFSNTPPWFCTHCHVYHGGRCPRR